MLKGTDVLWPDGESYEALMRMKIDEGDASFSSEKMNDPYDPELQIFEMERAKRFRTLWEGNTFAGVEWLDGSGKVVPREKLFRLIAFHDPALGKEPGQGKEPDYAAIIVVGQTHDGCMYCLDAWIEKDPPSVQVERAFLLHKKWGFTHLYLETNHFQKLLRQTYADAARKHGRGLFGVTGVDQYQNKVKRISLLQPEIANGYLRFAEDLSPRLIEQLRLFPTVNDDGPDALQGAVAQLKKPISDNALGTSLPEPSDDPYAPGLSPVYLTGNRDPNDLSGCAGYYLSAKEEQYNMLYNGGAY